MDENYFLTELIKCGLTEEEATPLAEAFSSGLGWANCYGEPGYTSTQPPRGVLLHDWNDTPQEVQDKLEAAGFALEWSDEWTIVYEHDAAAFRTQPSDWWWTPSVEWSRDGNEFCILDDPYDVIEEWKIDHYTQDLYFLPHWITDEHLQQHEWLRFGRPATSDIRASIYEVEDYNPTGSRSPQQIARDLLKLPIVAEVCIKHEQHRSFSLWYKVNDLET